MLGIIADIGRAVKAGPVGSATGGEDPAGRFASNSLAMADSAVNALFSHR